MAGKESLEEFCQACGFRGTLQLTVQGPDLLEEEVAISEGLPFAVIGRDPTADVLLDDPQVSRRHAYVQVIAGQLFCVDLKSRTGVHWPDGRKGSGWLEPSELIQIGPFTLRWAGCPKCPPEPKMDWNPLTAPTPATHPLPGVTLEFFEGSSRLDTWRVDRVLTLLGRSKACRISLADLDISRIHSGLLRTSQGIWVIDFLGKTGTFLNGGSVRWSRLDNGDLLQVGTFSIRVHHEAPPCRDLNAAPLETVEQREPKDSSLLSDSLGEESPVSVHHPLKLGAVPPVPVTAAAEFVDLLRESRLLSAAQAEEIAGDIAPRLADLRPLARELMERGWLTPFQINELVRRQGRHLVLGPYVLLARLGRGGMGHVFKAGHRLMDRLVALKVLRKDLLASSEAILRFQQEIRLAAQLSHPNVVLAYDGGLAGDTPYLALEYVEGTSLGKLIVKGHALTPDRVCDYIRQAALGLQHGHERGLVHRDVKPNNLLLQTRHGVVKLGDWGLARLLDPSGDGPRARLTRLGKVVGTSGFIAPEQILDSHRADTRADLYGLGCSFYYLLTRRLPFPIPKGIPHLIAVPKRDPPPVEKLCPGLHPAIAEVVHKMMAHSPEDRYQTAAEVAAALLPLSTRPATTEKKGP
jgi:pSer/pThr/pTyr-binding forkhead associated (FHA) protein